jgi:DNA-binding NtrC family response regulator
VVRIRLPSLRERLEDVPPLVELHAPGLVKDRRTRVRNISPGRWHALPLTLAGNVRELENVVQRATLMAKGETILPKDLPAEIQASRYASPPPPRRPIPGCGSGGGRATAGRSSAAPPVPRARFNAAPERSGPAPQAAPATHPLSPAPISLEDAFNILYERVRRERDEGIMELIERP